MKYSTLAGLLVGSFLATACGGSQPSAPADASSSEAALGGKTSNSSGSEVTKVVIGQDCAPDFALPFDRLTDAEGKPVGKKPALLNPYAKVENVKEFRNLAIGTRGDRELLSGSLLIGTAVYSFELLLDGKTREFPENRQSVIVKSQREEDGSYKLTSTVERKPDGFFGILTKKKSTSSCSLVAR